MGFHVETAEMKKALEHYQKLSKTAQEQLDNAKSSMNGIIKSNAMHGQVGKAITADINNNKNAVLVGLKNSYKLVESDLQQTYADFLGTTGETSESAVLDEEVLTKEKTAIDSFKTEHKEKRQSIQSTYNDIADLISLAMPSSSSFTNACEESKKQLDKIIQKVNEFDNKQQSSSAEEIIDVLSQQIKMSETASGLSYTDSRFMEFVSRTELAEAIKDIDNQIAEAEKQAKLEAEAEAKKKQEKWADRHPVENFLQSMSDSIGGWWGNVVEGTKNLSIPQEFKDILLFGEGFIGGAGSMVSSIAIGAAQLIHLGYELRDVGLNFITGTQSPQWKLDDIKGAWENTKAIGKTLGTVAIGVNAMLHPQLLLTDPLSREAAKQTFEMGAGIVNTIVNDIKSGNAYEIGGYVFDVASMFIGVGEVSAALKGTKLAGKLAEGMNAFKVAGKATTLSKLGKVTSIVDKALKYGDDAAKAFATKLKNIPMPIMDEVALAGGGSFKVVGKGTLGDYMKAAKANFSKGSGAVDDVGKKAGGAESSLKYKLDGKLLRDYVRDVETRTGRKLDKSQIEKIKEALRNKEYTKLSPSETKIHRRKFNNIKDSLIDEWEIQTGQKWPRYSEDLISEKTGKILRRKGDPYDAHHIIENSFGGEHEWWNMHPAKFPNEHQAGIHGTGSPASELFK